MFFKTIKYFLLLFLLISGFDIYAQTDTALNNQMKFDFGLVRDKNRHLWPLVYKHKTKDYKDLQLIFTIYRSYKSYETSYKHNHFLPFYWYDSSAAIKDLRIGTLYYPSLFRILNDTATKSKSFRLMELAPELNLLNITKSKTGLFTQNNLFFFIWSKNDATQNKSNFVVFPIYWYYHNNYRTTNTFFPLYRYVNISDRKETKIAFYPSLYFYKKENKDVRHSLGILFYNKKYEQYQTTKLAHKTVLFPLLFTHNNKNYSKFTLFPLVHFDKKKNTSWPESNLVVTPLFWHKQNSQFSRNVLFPIYWQKRLHWYKDTSRRTLLLPVYYSYVSNNNKIKYYMPLVWYNRSKSDTSLTVFPLFYKGNNYGNKYHTLLPFYFYKNNYEFKSKTIAFTPFYWQKKAPNYSSNLLIPFWYKVKYEHKNDTFYTQNFIPFVFYKRENREKQLAVIPFYYRKRDGIYGDTTTYIFPNYISYRNDEEQFRTVLPIYFSHKSIQKDENKTTKVLLPIWYYKSNYRQNDTIKTNILFPLYYHSKNKNESLKIILPLVYKQQLNYFDWHEKTFVFIPFYYNNQIDSTSKTTGITPFYWFTYNHNFKRTQTSKTLFPFWWYKNTTYGSNSISKSNTIFPLFFSKKEPNYRHTVLFPIVWKYQDSTYKSLTVFPFYQNYSLTNKSYQLSAYTPFLWRVKATNESKYFVFPFVWSDNKTIANDTIKNTVIFPFYWNYKSSYHHNTTVFPLYWSYKNKERKALTILPILYIDKYGKDSNAVKHSVVFPLYYKTKSFDYNHTTFFPLYFAKKTSKENNKVLFPIWYNYKNKKDTTKVLFPLYLRYKINDINTTAITPIYWHTKGFNYSKNVIFPIWWSKTDSISKYKLLLTIYYREKDNKGNSITGITPLFWNKTARNFSKNVLFPIWWSKTNSFEKYRTLFPLFHYQSTTDGLHKLIGVTPLYWYFKEHLYTSKTLFPIWFNQQQKGGIPYQSNLILPIIYTYKSNILSRVHVYPLVYANHKPQYQSFLFIPFYFHDKTIGISVVKNRTMLTPLIWINKDSSYGQDYKFRILPLFWHKYYFEKDYSKKSNTLFPIYFDVVERHNNSVTNRKHILFPIIFWRLNRNYKKSFTIFPIYHFNKKLNEQNLAITPLFWIINNGKKEQNLLWPIYNYNKQNKNTRFNIAYFLYRYQQTDKIKSWNVLWPIVQRIKGDNYSYFHIAPLVWYKKSDSMNYISIQPLFFSQKTKEFKRFQLLWQLYSYKKTFDLKTTNSFLWRTFYKDKYANGDHETRLLYKLYANVKKDSSTEKGLFPLYNVQHNKNGDYYKAYCLNIYQKTKTQVPNTNEYYLEEKVFWYIRLRSNFNYLKQKGVIKDRKSK